MDIANTLSPDFFKFLASLGINLGPSPVQQAEAAPMPAAAQAGTGQQPGAPPPAPVPPNPVPPPQMNPQQPMENIDVTASRPQFGFGGSMMPQQAPQQGGMSKYAPLLPLPNVPTGSGGSGIDIEKLLGKLF